MTSGSVAGAEMITFFAPASRCLAASSRFVNRPVDSITTSTPRSPQGSAAGIALGEHLDPLAVDDDRVVAARRPRPGSARGRVVLEQVGERAARRVMSLTATNSRSAPASWAARNRLRPIRPKPLIPTFTFAIRSPLESILSCSARRSRSGAHPGREDRPSSSSHRTRAAGPAPRRPCRPAPTPPSQAALTAERPLAEKHTCPEPAPAPSRAKAKNTGRTMPQAITASSSRCRRQPSEPSTES